MPTSTMPSRPTDPTLVLDPLNYLWGAAAVTQDVYYAHVLGAVTRWLADEDPFPDPPPDDEGMRKVPPPPPPPMPAYPIGDLIDALALTDPTGMVAWTVVRVALSNWLTYGPFGA